MRTFIGVGSRFSKDGGSKDGDLFSRLIFQVRQHSRRVQGISGVLNQYNNHQ